MSQIVALKLLKPIGVPGKDGRPRSTVILTLEEGWSFGEVTVASVPGITCKHPLGQGGQHLLFPFSSCEYVEYGPDAAAELAPKKSGKK